MQPRDLGGVHERLGPVGRGETAQSRSEAIRDQVGEAVERVVVVPGRISADRKGRGGGIGRHRSP